MKKITIITALLAALMLLASCGGGGTGNPVDDISDGYAGLTELNEEVLSVSKLITGVFDWDVDPTIENLTGTWTETTIEKRLYPTPKIAYKCTQYFTFTSSGSGNISCSVHFVYDYSAAIAELGVDKWPAIRDSEMAGTEWTPDNANYKLTTGPCSVYSGTSIANCLDAAFNPESGNVIEMTNPDKHWFNAVVEAWKIRIRQSNGNTLRVIVKQNQQN